MHTEKKIFYDFQKSKKKQENTKIPKSGAKNGKETETHGSLAKNT